MKKLIIIFLAMLFAAGMMAQDKPIPPNPPLPPTVPEVPDNNRKNDDTIKIKVGNYKVIIIDNEKNKKVHDNDTVFIDTLNAENDEEKDHPKAYKSWAGFDFGVNGYLNADKTTKMPAGYEFLEVNYRRSFSYALNVFEKDIPIISDYFKLATGLGIEWNNYIFTNNIRLTADSAKIYGYTDTLIKFDKTKLGLTYLNLPILFQINTNSNPKDAFHFSFGVIISYNIRAKTKLVYNVNDKTNRDKVVGDYHVNPLRYGLTARVGYGKFKVFANYNLSSLFVKDEGPDLYPFTVGITVISF